VIAIHGLGDSPERFRPLFDQLGVPARLIVARALDPWPVGSSWFPIDDRKRAGTVLRARARELADFATRLTKMRKTRGPRTSVRRCPSRACCPTR
jgi:phospholipase/carboxylesterase